MSRRSRRRRRERAMLHSHASKAAPFATEPKHIAPLPSATGATKTTTTKADTCRHNRQPVALLEGTVFASAYRNRKDETTEPEADVSVYLDHLWASARTAYSRLEVFGGLELPPEVLGDDDPANVGNPAVYVPWRDHAGSPEVWARVAPWILGRVADGQRVEIGCHGGHGRTGSAIASLRILQGDAPGHAIEWVRVEYCSKAIEGPEQVTDLVELAVSLGTDIDHDVVEAERKYTPGTWPPVIKHGGLGYGLDRDACGWTPAAKTALAEVLCGGDEPTEAWGEVVEDAPFDDDDRCTCGHLGAEHDSWTASGEGVPWTWCMASSPWCECDGFDADKIGGDAVAKSDDCIDGGACVITPTCEPGYCFRQRTDSITDEYGGEVYA